MSNPASPHPAVMQEEPLTRMASFEPREEESLDSIAKSGSSRPVSVLLTPDAHTSTPPLSFAQERLWVISQFHPGLNAYHIPVAVRVTGPLNYAALQSAVTQVIERHSVLRATFPTANGNVTQTIAPASPIQLPIKEVARDDASIESIIHDALVEPFDLARGPLFRLRLLRVHETDHTLVLVIHHLVFDGGSIGVLTQDLSTLYEANVFGTSSALPPLKIQYGDYARREREDWRIGNLDSQLKYWEQKLASLENLALPTDKRRPEIQSFKGAWYPFELGAQLSQQIATLNRRHSATMFMTLLGAFQILLHRYSGQSDIAVGTPISGRSHPDLEPLVGLLVNTLVIRGKVTPHQTVSQFLKELRETCLDAYSNQNVPFEKIVEELNPERDISRNPLFQALFSLSNVMPASTRPQNDLGLAHEPLETVVSKFDITLSLEDDGAAIRGGFEYNTSLFEKDTVARMAEHYLALLKKIATDPEEKIEDLRMLSSGETKQVITEWNETKVQYPSLYVHELFERQANSSPSAIAVTFEGEEITYKELNLFANQIAHKLTRIGVGPETVVAVSMERSIEMVAGLIAILKCGAAYLPLDPELPPARTSQIIEQALPHVVITQFPEQVSKLGGHPSLVHLTRDAFANEPGDNLDQAVIAEQAVYVIYTSGSTGQPKGVINQHRSLSNRIQWMQDTYKLSSIDRVLQKTPYSFDVSVWELFWPLSAGATMVLAKPGGHRDPEYLGGLIESERVTVLHFVPSMLDAFIEAGQLGTCSGVRLLFCSGEVLAMPTLLKVASSLTAEIHNLYGPTEAAIDVSSWRCSRNDQARRSVPIGRPIGNTQLYILDDTHRPVPIGVLGTLYIGGSNVARGYLKEPALTAERFVPDPFSSRPGGRLYNTGDLARHHQDGSIEFEGRADQQIKIRGFRVEPGEIEFRLRALDSVRDAVVILHVQENGPPVLLAYLTRRSPGEIVTDSDVKTCLRIYLPEHMIPSSIVWLESLPLTASGKLDRSALSQLPTREQLGGRYCPPTTADERALVSILCTILNSQRIGTKNNLFDLGCDSIRCIQLVARARELGIEFSLQDIFQHPTIEGLAHLNKAEAAQPAAAQLGRFALIDEEAQQRIHNNSDIVDAYPLTQLQLGMLYHTEYAEGSGTYHDVVSLRLSLAYDEDALRESLRRIALSHEILRTSFELINFSSPLQIVHREVAIPLTVTDIRRLEPEERERSLKQWLSEEKTSTFDWNTAPLYRVHVHIMHEGEIQFSLSFHHAIMDGWSVASFLTMVFELYNDLLVGRAASIVPLQTSFRDFVHSELKAMKSAEASEFWRRSLDGIASLRTRWLTRVSSWGREITELRSLETLFPNHICQKLHRVAQDNSVPLKSLLLAAHLRVVAAYYGVNDVVTGLAIHNRPRTSDSEKVLGLFVNVVPFRLTLKGGLWTSLLQSTFSAEQDIVPYQEYPGTLMQQGVGHGPMFEWVFNYVHFHVYGAIASQAGPAIMQGEFFEKTNYPLASTFSSGIADKSIRLAFSYDAAQISETRVRGIVAAYQAVLEEITLRSDARYDFHDYLLCEDRERLLTDGTNDSSDRTRASTIDQMFAQRAKEQSDVPAIVSGTRTLTYEELDRESTQLAGYLIAHGVGPEVRVGVCLGRSVDTVVSFLAIMKAGGAYVPLDAEYPASRLEFMLKDSNVRVLVTKGRLLARLVGFHGVIIRLDRDKDVIDRQESGSLTPLNLLESTAYVIYTSGSTGSPKGVIVPHRGIANIVSSYLGVRCPVGQERVLQYSSPSFDGCICEFVIALLGGGTLCIVPPGPILQGQELADFVRDQEITWAILPPAVLAELPQSPLCQLKTLGSAGETCPPSLPARWSPGRRFLNVYGPTETTIYATIAIVETPDHPVPIGLPIPGVQVYLLDEFILPTPIGTVGELHISGVGLATGYVGCPALTAERFLPNPFSTSRGARMYRTGDLARYREDGQIEYIGRSDQQLKVRGHRIEPGEIEGALMTHDGVRLAIVQARGSAPNDRSVVAYLEPSSATIPTTEELRSFLGARLPAYLIPNSFVWIGSVPKNANGKIEYDRLSDMEPLHLIEKRALARPAKAMELLVADIWKSVLGIDEVGLDDSFLSLGGHSLKFLQVQKHLYAKTQHQIPIRDLYNHLTLRELAIHLEHHCNSNGSTSPPWSPLVMLRGEGLGDGKFFCVHPLGGGVSVFSELARLLGDVCDFYAFQAMDLETAGVAGYDHASIEQFATAYVSYVIEVDPYGPYMIGGLSFGGIVAFEMARQLELRGKTVSLLALLDSRGPQWKMPDASDEELLVGFAREHAAASGSEISLSFNDILGKDLASAMRLVDDQLAAAGLHGLGLDALSIHRFLRGVHERITMAQAYSPAVYGGEVTLFHAFERDPHLRVFYDQEDPSYGWDSSVITPIRVIDVPGNHATFCAQPNVEILAQRLAECITAARALSVK